MNGLIAGKIVKNHAFLFLISHTFLSTNSAPVIEMTLNTVQLDVSYFSRLFFYNIWFAK